MPKLVMRNQYRTCAPALSRTSAPLLLLTVARAAIFGTEAVPVGTIWADGAPLEQEVADLKARVATSLAEEQRLARTNAELHREVDGWVDVGKKVLSREAHIVDALKQTGGKAADDQASFRATVLAGLSEPETKPGSMLATGSTVQTKTHSAGHLPSLLISWQVFVVFLTVLAAFAFCWLRGPVGVQGHMKRLLSRPKHLQLTELQLEGAGMGFGEGYMLVQPSGGLRTRTRQAGQNEGSSILRFDEVVTLSVQKGDGPCVITVFRRGELQDTRIGTVSLQASELLSCVAPGPEACQYFRFNVQASSPEYELRVAMRIRDLTGTNEAPKAGSCYRTKSLAHVL